MLFMTELVNKGAGDFYNSNAILKLKQLLNEDITRLIHKEILDITEEARKVKKINNKSNMNGSPQQMFH